MAKLSFEDRMKLVAEYQKWTLNYVINTFFTEPPHMSNSKIFNNATSTFVDTGHKKIVITNYHVIEKYNDLKKIHNAINFQLGSLVITDIDNRIISKNKYYDLVTYEISEDEISSLNKQFCLFTSWPPREVKKDELLVFAGYPGIWRDIKSPGNVYFQSAIFMEEIKSTSPENFKIHLDYDNYNVLLGSRKFEELTDYGGFSGAGVFRINDKKAIATLEPVGIIYEGSKNWEIQIASHINVINIDGKIF